MRWSQQLGRVAGIGIFVHWTFLLLIGWVVLVHFLEGDSPQTALTGVLFVLAIFVCVLLHELGHALAAKKFGVATHDITLLPIGGVARLERMPEQPSQELAVALAGPAVNFVIAGVLLATVAFFEGLRALLDIHVVGGSFLAKLMWVNVFLAFFNLLPAFPMDGGRVLRALLANRMEYVRATQVAATVGQGMAIVFAVLGFFSNWFLLFIALFVYLGAQGEAHQVQVRSVLRGVPVDAAMTTRFRCLDEEEQISVAVEELLAGHQHDFPVMREGRLSGVLTRENLIQAVAAGRRDAVVSEFTVRDFPVVQDGAMLEDVFAKMQEGHASTVPVLRNGKLVGLLTLENIGEWMMIQSAFRQSAAAGIAPAGFTG